MNRTTLAIVPLMVVLCGFAQMTASKDSEVTAEITDVRSNGIDVKLVNGSSRPVYVWVCGTPSRLNDLGYHFEWFSGGEWERLEPYVGAVRGDLPPVNRALQARETATLPANISWPGLGIPPGSTLRIVVQVFPNSPGEKPFHVRSSPFQVPKSGRPPKGAERGN